MINERLKKRLKKDRPSTTITMRIPTDVVESLNPSSRIRGVRVSQAIDFPRGDPQRSALRRVVDATWVAVIFGGGCGGRASLSFSNNSCNSGSGCV